MDAWANRALLDHSNDPPSIESEKDMSDSSAGCRAEVASDALPGLPAHPWQDMRKAGLRARATSPT